jgi:hypothetical protein
MKFKFEFIIFIITAALILNTYYDGKYFKLVESGNARKYIKMATIGFFGLSMYLFMKKNPENSHNIMQHANEFIKYMPISRQSADMLTPFFDMTNQRAFFGQGGNSTNASADNDNDSGWTTQRQQNSVNKIMTSGKTGGGAGPTKRSVSESKKKFVAAQQGWKCGDCKRQLPGWFEVDHKIRLEHGGSNAVDNLVALCRDCHGKKTAFENF